MHEDRPLASLSHPLSLYPVTCILFACAHRRGKKTSCGATRATSLRPALPSSSSVRRCSAPASATSQPTNSFFSDSARNLFFCAASTRTATPTAPRRLHGRQCAAHSAGCHLGERDASRQLVSSCFCPRLICSMRCSSVGAFFMSYAVVCCLSLQLLIVHVC